MSDRHYDDEDLVAWLFGLGPEDAHLTDCDFCARRWEQIRRTHQVCRSAGIEVPAEFLAAQRRAIYARVEHKPRNLHLRWASVPVAALLVLLMVFSFVKPVSQKHLKDAISDDQALQDVFMVGSRTEPAGLQPVESLFEVQK